MNRTAANARPWEHCTWFACPEFQGKQLSHRTVDYSLSFLLL